MLEPLKSNSFWSLPPSIPPSLHPSGFRFPLFFFFFFFPLPTAKLVNIKYLLFYFGFCFFFLLLLLLYCCSCNFFFSSSRPAQQRPGDYPQSQSVNTISFQSLVHEGKTEQNVSFLFSLPPLLSSERPLFPHKCCHNCFIYCVVGFFFFFDGWVKLRDSFLFCFVCVFFF